MVASKKQITKIEDPTFIHNMKSDRYNRSISKHPHQQRSQSPKQSIVKYIPRQRHRSDTKTRSDSSIIHVTVRPTTNNIHTFQDKSRHFKDGFYSVRIITFY